MSFDVSGLISNLKKSSLIAECPYCSEDFSISQALLFDGRMEFPSKAEEKRLTMLDELKERTAELLERQKRATTKAEKTDILHIQRFHEYVHSSTIHPESDALKAKWDNLQEFFEILWNDINIKKK